ncbi:MAG: hypothetical protein AAF961_18885, partial [Planctomycetota bacterium]
MKALAPTLLLFVALAFHGPSATGELVKIEVFPTIARSIAGVCELDRQRYFAMCDSGSGFDVRMKSAERADYLLDELQATFGRRLDPIRGVVGPANKLVEDADRPGFADLGHVDRLCRERRRMP